MKKIKFYSFASALLLAAAAGLGSCASEADTEGGSSQQQNETRDVVKTQFVINIPYANGSSSSNARTRMTDENTQNKKGQNAQYNNFRGIENMILLTFATKPGETQGDDNGDTSVGSLCNISSDANAFSQDDYRRLYRDLQIPVGTKYFIMHGCAKRDAEESGTYFQQGRITPKDGYSKASKLSELEFNLTPILSENTTKIENSTITSKLNDLLNAQWDYSQSQDGTNIVKWKEISTIDDGKLPGDISSGEKSFLAERFKRLKSLKAGSAASVLSVLEGLKEVLIAGSSTSETTKIDESKKLATEIYNKCVAAIKEINVENVKNFPRNLNLPDGVAKLEYSESTNTFSYAGSTVNFGENNTIDYTKICYPAELSYFVSTPAMISNDEINKVGDNNLPTYENWLKGIWPESTSFTNAAEKGSQGVTTSTHSVALKDPVQYSVACLKTTVKCQGDSDSQLEDNAVNVTKDYGSAKLTENQKITIPDDGYQLTAILVGGQPATVDWKFEPKDKTSSSYANTIYDKDMNTISGTDGSTGTEKYIKVTNGTASTPNYTLVLDNETSSTESQNTVYVTLEFNNNGDAFYGADGLVPKNGKFYLVGSLNPTSTSDTTSKTDCKHVFIKDHTTVANFTIKSLKNAYNCIPDLRAAGLNVGLAIDLSWQDGLTFNDVEL